MENTARRGQVSFAGDQEAEYDKDWTLESYAVQKLECTADGSTASWKPAFGCAGIRFSGTWNKGGHLCGSGCGGE